MLPNQRTATRSPAKPVNCIVTLLMFACVLSAGMAAAHPPSQLAERRLADREPDQSLNADEEAFVHTPPGFSESGQPMIVGPRDPHAGILRVRILEDSSKTVTACRVNVVGPQGHFYEPVENRLAAWSRQKTDPGETHGPSRYFGWHFYTPGQFEVRVPAGEVRVEAWKGFEYRPIKKELVVAAGETLDVSLQLVRTMPMDEFNFYSGDTHIHLNRRNEDEDQLALDLMAAEDIQFGFLLCMNNPPSYSGVMERQEWPQQQGFGPSSVRTRGRWGIASGQEYRSGSYGHICLLMHDQLVLDGVTVDANNWPPFDIIGRETRRLGGVSFHAHGGYSAEIFANYIRQSTDGVELLQMAHYRGIGLRGWYRILNLGFRFPGLAGSDFPYSRCLGDCRNYAYSVERPDFAGWARAAATGRSFFTTGPLVLLEVEGKRPGDVIDLAASGGRTLSARVRVRSEVAPFQRIELVMGGETIHSMPVPQETSVGHWHELWHEVEIERPTWIAARVFGISSTGRPDAEAHTNPIYIDLDGERPFHLKDRDWLLKKLDGRIAAVKRREFPEKDRVLEIFQAARHKLLSRSP